MRFNRIQRAQASRKHGAETPVTNKATTEEEDDETVMSSSEENSIFISQSTSDEEETESDEEERQIDGKKRKIRKRSRGNKEKSYKILNGFNDRILSRSRYQHNALFHRRRRRKSFHRGYGSLSSSIYEFNRKR